MILSGCEAAKVLQSTYNMKNCNYKYDSISNLKISDIDLSKGLSVVNTAKALSILNGSASSIPLDFTLNIEVHNPNTSHAAFQALQYIIRIDDIEFTTGNIAQAFSVASGETKQLPIHIGIDLATLASNHSKTTIGNIVKNFIGIGDEKSNVALLLKPTYHVGGSTITSPVYIPVGFTFGGRK